MLECNVPKQKQQPKKHKEDDVLENIRKYRQIFNMKEKYKGNVNGFISERDHRETNSPVIHLTSENFAKARENEKKNTNENKTEVLAGASSPSNLRKDIPQYHPREVMPFHKYRELLMKRAYEVQEAQNSLSPPGKDLKDLKEFKEKENNAIENKKKKEKFMNLSNNQEKIIIENKLIASKGDRSSMFSPSGNKFSQEITSSNYQGRKKAVGNTFSGLTTARSPEKLTSKTKNNSTTIGFMCKDEEVVCEDFKSEMERLSIQNYKKEQQRIQEEEQKQYEIKQLELKQQEEEEEERKIVKEKLEYEEEKARSLSKKKIKIRKHGTFEKIKKRYERFDVEQLSYKIVREYSHLKLANNKPFMERMTFDVDKRQAKPERMKKMIKEQQVKIDETERIATFNRLIDDANRRVEIQLNGGQKLNEKEELDESSEILNTSDNNKSKSKSAKKIEKAKKKYNPNQWKEIYTSRFFTYENERLKKREARKKEKEYQDLIEEERILHERKEIKGNEKFIKGVIDRMNEDAERRKLGIDKKCKIERSEVFYSNSVKEEVGGGTLKNFKKKSKKGNNYIFSNLQSDDDEKPVGENIEILSGDSGEVYDRIVQTMHSGAHTCRPKQNMIREFNKERERDEQVADFTVYKSVRNKQNPSAARKISPSPITQKSNHHHNHKDPMLMITYPEENELKTEIQGKSSLKINDLGSSKIAQTNKPGKKFFPGSLAEKVVNDIMGKGTKL